MPILFTDNSNMFIDHQKGSIGIGVSSSTSNLHVVGQTFLNGNLTVSGITSITTLSVSGSGISGILNTTAQPNITLLGTLTNLTVNTGLVVLSNGNVGLGTNNPSANLHVVGPVNLISSTGQTGFYMRLGNVGIGTSTPNANLQVFGTSQLLGLTGTTGLYVNTLGNIGIGVNAPNANLHVVGPVNLISSTGTTGLYMRLGNVGIGTDTPNANLQVFGTSQLLGLSGTTGLYVNTLGNIGIGVNTPTANLHVMGSTIILGNVGIGTTIAIANLHVLGHTRLLGQSGLTGLYISNIGNVGIGTAFPMANLHVLGNSQLLNLASTTGLYISNTGNVGIGTSVPNGNLHVLGYTQILGQSGSTGLYVSNIGNVGIGTAFPMANLHVLGNSQILGLTGTTGLYISNTGNVGIGTSVPTANLHINTNSLNPLNITQSITQGTGTFTRMTTLMNSGLSTNETTTIQLGQTDSARNCGYLGFTYQSSGSLTNCLTLGLHSVNQVINIAGTGNVGIGSTTPTNKLDVTGGITTTLFNNFSISSPVVSSSTSTTNILTFPSAGVYLLFVSAQGGTSSSTPTTTDNLSHVYLAVVAVSNYVVYLTGLYKPNTTFFNVTSTTALTVNLVVNSGSFTYAFYYQKIF